MKRSIVFVASFAAFAAEAQMMAGWTPEMKRAVVTGCRTTFTNNALRDAAARNNVPLESVSKEKRAEFERWIEPYLAPCSCVADHITMKWTFADYNANQEKYKPEIQALTMGRCAPPAPK